MSGCPAVGSYVQDPPRYGSTADGRAVLAVGCGLEATGNNAEQLPRKLACSAAYFSWTDDNVIPVRMGRELTENFRRSCVFPVAGADYVNVLDIADPEILGAKNQ